MFGIKIKKNKLEYSLKTRLQKSNTIDDFLARDEVNDALNDLVKEKSSIEKLITIYETVDGEIHYRISNLSTGNILEMMERVKIMLLNDEE